MVFAIYDFVFPCNWNANRVFGKAKSTTYQKEIVNIISIGYNIKRIGVFEMKKIIPILLLSVILCGCEKVEKEGIYKTGTYTGAVSYESYGKEYVTTATIYVGKYGNIESCYIDSTYETKEGVITTKKTLGDAYAMRGTSANIGIIPGGAEWYEQVEKIEKKVIEEQNLDWVKWGNTEKNKLDLDIISGVTITADTYIEAVNQALEQAKK